MKGNMTMNMMMMIMLKRIRDEVRKSGTTIMSMGASRKITLMSLSKGMAIIERDSDNYDGVNNDGDDGGNDDNSDEDEGYERKVKKEKKMKK